MPPVDQKNPFSDEIDVGSTDPSNLFTGGSSKMFANERLRGKSKRLGKQEAEREATKAQVAPIAAELQKFLDKLKADNDNIGSYLRELYATQGKPKVTEEDLRVEFRARQMNLETIRKIETWIQGLMRRSR